MKLLVQPDDGVAPLVNAVRHAKKSVLIVVFRFDLKELEQALAHAVERGVAVRALIANTNRGGEKRLRKLEQRLLAAGVQVARTGDDLVRYHGKVMLVDDTLYVLGFNYTKLDAERSRSFGLIAKDAKLVKCATELFECDASRQPFTPGDDRFVVSPENSRTVLTDFVKGAKKSLLMYDMNIADPRMLKVLAERIKAGVDVRVIGKVKQPPEGMGLRKMVKLRLHARMMVRDGTRAFVGSQSLRKMELEQRREIGLIVTERRIAKRLQDTFESDWEAAKPKLEPASAEADATAPAPSA
jgi:cardiolipin synthase